MRRAWVLVWAAVWALVGSAGPARAGVDAAWTWPLGDATAVGRAFDPPAHRYGSGHRGVDLAAPAGTPVVAAGGGRVSYAGLLAGRGVVVVVHGELRTTYEPVDAAVAVGQVVATGEVLGTLAAGHLGCSASACLHWGLRRGEEYLDPLLLVGGGPVRLLPLGPPDGAGGGAEPLRDPTGPAGVGAPAGEVAGGADGRAGTPGGTGRSSGSADGSRPASSGEGPDSPPAGPEPTSDAAPSLDAQLRSAASPSGAVALLALVAGIALLRPGRPPRRPGGAAAGAVGEASPSAVTAAAGTASARSPLDGAHGLGAERPEPAAASSERAGADQLPGTGAAAGVQAAALRCSACTGGGPADDASAAVVDLTAERDRRRAGA